MDDDGLFSVGELQQNRAHSSQYSREELCDRYANLVYKVAQGIHRHLLSNVLLEDLIAYGQTGLLEAYERFSGDFKVSFSTFAYYRIRGEILDACRRAGWGMKTKKSKGFLEFEEQIILNEFLESEFFGPKDDPDQIDMQNIPLEDRSKYHDSFNYLNNVVSDTAVIILLRRSQSDFGRQNPTQDRRVQKKQRNKILHKHVKLLDEPSQQVLYLYYFQEYSMQEIADQMDISKSWVCRLHSRALKALGKSMKSVMETL